MSISAEKATRNTSYSLFLFFFSSRANETWVHIETAKCVDHVGRKSPGGRIYCFVKFPNKPAHERTRGSWRAMAHECVRRARTMVQLRMYRRLLSPEYNLLSLPSPPSLLPRHHPRNSSFSLAFSRWGNSLTAVFSSAIRRKLPLLPSLRETLPEISNYRGILR